MDQEQSRLLLCVIGGSILVKHSVLEDKANAALVRIWDMSPTPLQAPLDAARCQDR